ncbi:MAG: hypothetical protein V7641_1981 [Blastocatellia bacterium]
MATTPRTIVILITLLGLAVAAPALAQRVAQKKRPATTVAKAPTAQQRAEFNKLAKQADAAREAGRLEDAIRLYNQALQMNPKWAEGWWYLGSIFYDRDRYSEAREALKLLLYLQRENGPAWTLLGLCEFQLRNYKEALADILQGKQLGLGGNKEFVSVARYHGSILLTRNGQFEIAFEELRPFSREGNESLSVIEAFGINILRLPLLPAELPPDKRELVLLAGRAAWHQSARHPQEADRAYKELLARYPQAPNANYAYGVFQLIDTPDAALDSFRRELQVKPDNVPAMLQIAFEYIKRNDYEQALPFAQKSVDIAPEFFATHNALGRVLLEMGKIPEAIKELETGVKQAPDSPEMRFALARAYAKAGRSDDARREREIFLQLDKQMRELREGTQSTGGVDSKPVEKNQPPR